MILHSRPYITREDTLSLEAVLASGQLAHGPTTKKFESLINEAVKAKKTRALSSGTAAITAALILLNIDGDSEVVMPTYVCEDVLQAVLDLGARPVFCDMGNGWSMTPDAVRPKVTLKTRAIIAVHTFGITCDLSEFEQQGIPVIEDCAQSFLGPEQNKTCLSAFSFHATKCLTTGEGGAVSVFPSFYKLTGQSEAQVTAKLDLLAKRYVFSDMQAALGCSQFERYPQFLSRRRQLAQNYFEHLKLTQSTLSIEIKGKSIFFRFPLLSKVPFNKAQELFLIKNIHVRKGVDQLLHRKLDLSDQFYVRAATLIEQTICLPIYPALSDNEQMQIITAANSIL